jgi:hypothetical protein
VWLSLAAMWAESTAGVSEVVGLLLQAPTSNVAPRRNITDFIGFSFKVKEIKRKTTVQQPKIQVFRAGLYN